MFYTTRKRWMFHQNGASCISFRQFITESFHPVWWISNSFTDHVGCQTNCTMPIFRRSERKSSIKFDLSHFVAGKKKQLCPLAMMSSSSTLTNHVYYFGLGQIILLMGSDHPKMEDWIDSFIRNCVLADGKVDFDWGWMSSKNDKLVRLGAN